MYSESPTFEGIKFFNDVQLQRSLAGVRAGIKIAFLMFIREIRGKGLAHARS